MPLLESLVRLKQIHNPELSGYILSVVHPYTGSSQTILTGTGLNYSFVGGNEIGVITQTSGSNQTVTISHTGNTFESMQTWVDAYYYPRANTSGYVTQNFTDTRYITGNNQSGLVLYNSSLGQNDFMWKPYAASAYYLKGSNNSIVDLYGNTLGVARPTISGFNVISGSGNFTALSVNNTPVLLAADLLSFVPWSFFRKGGQTSGFNYFRANNPSAVGEFLFDSTGTFSAVGSRIGFPSEVYMIDFYGTRSDAPVPLGKPFIYGFDVFAGALSSSGNRVLTTLDSGYFATTTQLLATSGSLMDSINSISISGGSVNVANAVYTTGNQTIVGLKTIENVSGLKVKSSTLADYNLYAYNGIFPQWSSMLKISTEECYLSVDNSLGGSKTLSFNDDGLTVNCNFDVNGVIRNSLGNLELQTLSNYDGVPTDNILLTVGNSIQGGLGQGDGGSISLTAGSGLHGGNIQLNAGSGAVAGAEGLINLNSKTVVYRYDTNTTHPAFIVSGDTNTSANLDRTTQANYRKVGVFSRDYLTPTAFATSGSAAFFEIDSSNYGHLWLQGHDGTSRTRIHLTSSDGRGDFDGDVTAANLYANSKIGAGTVYPYFTLDVNGYIGNSAIDPLIYIDVGNGILDNSQGPSLNWATRQLLGVWTAELDFDVVGAVSCRNILPNDNYFNIAADFGQNVGINMEYPMYKLDVNGDVRMLDTLLVANGITLNSGSIVTPMIQSDNAVIHELEFNTNEIYCNANDIAIDFNNAQLIANMAPTSSLDWQQRILSGNWRVNHLDVGSDLTAVNANFSGLFVNGIPVSTGNVGNVTNVVFTTGNQTISGNKVFIGDTSFSGNAFFSGNLKISGQPLSSYFVTTGQTGVFETSAHASSTYATITNLAATGTNLTNQILSLSGNLLSTGINLNTQIAALSGTVTSTYATATNLVATGTSLTAKISALSGTMTSTYETIVNVAATGTALTNKISSLSGNLLSTGVSLSSQISALSGTVTSTYATITNLATTGTTLANQIAALSGTTSSVYATVTNLAATGTNLTNQITSLSGNLLSSGITLSNQIGALSGTVVGNYATIINLAATGTTNANRIFALSGTVGSTYETIVNVAATGTTLSNKVSALSGTLTSTYLTTATAASTYATITNLAATGTTLTNQVSSLSGNLLSTGINLATQISALSGTVSSTYVTAATVAGTYATITNLAATGTNLANQISALSGTTSSVYATVANLSTTGATLNARISALSGTVTSTYGTIANVATTGTTLTNKISSLSGNLLSTGINIEIKIASLSGTMSSTYATITNLAATGTNLQNQVTAATNAVNSAFSATNNNVAALQTWTGISTGLFYPRTGNPMGFVSGAAGQHGQLQINRSGALSGDSRLTWDNGELTVLNLDVRGNIHNNSGDLWLGTNNLLALQGNPYANKINLWCDTSDVFHFGKGENGEYVQHLWIETDGGVTINSSLNSANTISSLSYDGYRFHHGEPTENPARSYVAVNGYNPAYFGVGTSSPSYILDVNCSAFYPIGNSIGNELNFVGYLTFGDSYHHDYNWPNEFVQQAGKGIDGFTAKFISAVNSNAGMGIISADNTKGMFLGCGPFNGMTSIGASDMFIQNGATAPGYLRIMDGNGNISNNMTLLVGAVGIANTNPVYPLDVSGSARISGNLFLSGNYSVGLLKASGNFTIATGNAISLVDTTATAATGTLPNASGVMGMQYTIKDWKGTSATKFITLTGVNGQTFDGSTNRVISSNYDSLTLVSDGQNWAII